MLAALPDKHPLKNGYTCWRCAENRKVSTAFIPLCWRGVCKWSSVMITQYAEVIEFWSKLKNSESVPKEMLLRLADAERDDFLLLLVDLDMAQKRIAFEISEAGK